MREATYITHTSNGHRYIRDKKDTRYDDRLARWFETELPGDDIVTLRETLIRAAVHLSTKDTQLLVNNGFAVTTISLEQSWYERISEVLTYVSISEVLTYVKFGDTSDLINMSCKEHAITPGYANVRTVGLVLKYLHADTHILR